MMDDVMARIGKRNYDFRHADEAHFNDGEPFSEQLADWLEDCEEALIAAPAEPLPLPRFRFNEAYAHVRRAAIPHPRIAQD